MIPTPPRPPTPRPEEGITREQRRIAVEELFAGARELRIVHGEEEYRLSLTRNGKLILTK